jgi:hypothetical protein
MATLIGSLPQAGGTATIQTSSGAIVQGTNAGGNGGITVGPTTYYPTNPK